MPITRIEFGPGGNPREDWIGRDDVLWIERGEWRKLLDISPGSINEIYLANVTSWPGERVSRELGGRIFRVPVPIAYNYLEMVRWAAMFHRLLCPGGTVTIFDDNTPVYKPDYYIVGPFTEQDRFTLVGREEVESNTEIPGYKLVFQKQ